jgi:hypothetical protein
LSLVYVGIESGSDDILKRVRKGSASAMQTALKAAHDAGLRVSATVILGLGGKRLWREHIEQTAALINCEPPKFLSTLQLGLDSRARAEFEAAFAKRPFAGQAVAFEEQDDGGVLDELALLLDRLAPPRPVIFRSNHASNCLALAGTLPKDRDRLILDVQRSQGDARTLRPRSLRGF